MLSRPGVTSLKDSLYIYCNSISHCIFTVGNKKDILVSKGTVIWRKTSKNRLEMFKIFLGGLRPPTPPFCWAKPFKEDFQGTAGP